MVAWRQGVQRALEEVQRSRKPARHVDPGSRRLVQGGVLDRPRFDRVAQELHRRYRWR